MRTPKPFWAAPLLSVVLPLSGCVAEVRPEPVYVEARAVPADIEVYPRAVYGGRFVYLVNGHWYYRQGPRWVYYRTEPPVLRRERIVVERAPRAYPRRRRPAERRYYSPSGPPPGLRSAPPATQVR